MSKKIIGIDPGTRITGYGIVSMDNSHLSALDFGCIRPPTDLSNHERYFFLFNATKQLFEQFSPSAVAVETQFVYKNIQSAMKLAMARMTTILAAATLNIPIFEYAPRQAKLAVVGNGAASKQQVQKMVQLLLKLPYLPEPEDAADALALAICHAHSSIYTCSSRIISGQKPIKSSKYSNKLSRIILK